MFKCYHRCHHSTETVLLKVRNNILLNMNKQHVTILVLLDLSAAFNTVHHEILLESMTSKLSIGGTVLISLLFISSVAAGSCWSQAIEIIPAWLWRSARVLSWAAVIAAVYLKSLRLTYLKFIPMQTIPNYTFHSALVTLCVKMLLWVPWRPALPTSRSGPNRIVLCWTMIKLNLLWSEPVSN